MGNVSKTERHLRWNYEPSPDGEKLRYHFVVVDDKCREGKIFRALHSLQQLSALEPIRTVEGKVEGTEFRYLFQSFDVNIRPAELDLTKVGKTIWDKGLYERQPSWGIERYVEGIYSEKKT